MTIGKGAVTVETEDDHCTDDECRCDTAIYCQSQIIRER